MQSVSMLSMYELSTVKWPWRLWALKKAQDFLAALLQQLQRVTAEVRGQNSTLQPGSPTGALVTFFFFQDRIISPFSLCVKIFKKILLLLFIQKLYWMADLIGQN